MNTGCGCSTAIRCDDERVVASREDDQWSRSRRIACCWYYICVRGRLTRLLSANVAKILRYPRLDCEASC
jgi:hypothetical protein